MATRRRGQGGERSRPQIKSSHEKVKTGHVARRPRPASRTPPTMGAARERTRGSKKTRPADTATARASDPTTPSVSSESARETATAIAVAALEKKAVALQILDVAGKVDYADFLVIMTGHSDRHAQALAQGIEDALKKKGIRPIALEGLPHATWVLIDFGDVVVHVFQDEARQLYDIESLWLDARRIGVSMPTSEG